MKDRIKKVRTKSGLTQTKFGEKIGVKGNTITNYETGLRNPTDAVIRSICREFGVNEEWLRTGEGDMFIAQSKNQELLDFLSKIQELDDEAFKKRFALALSRMSPEGWDAIESFIDSLKS